MPDYDDILEALLHRAGDLERESGNAGMQGRYAAEKFLKEDARLLREAMEIVRERRDQGEAVRPPQEMDLG